jgi:uncharacterized protein YdeI (YjbR/CyaY-like superfamily)
MTENTSAKAAARFFKTKNEFRSWLEKNHDSSNELVVGFYRKNSGRPSITWPDSVDVALCFGWIDGIRRSIDDESYSIRFTPRKKLSIWSAVNIKRVGVLIASGEMTPSGLSAFEVRKENKSGIYSYEQKAIEFDVPYRRVLEADLKAREFFDTQPASYKRAAIWWVHSAKREETRLARLGKLIKYSALRERIPQFTSTKSKKVAEE